MRLGSVQHQQDPAAGRDPTLKVLGACPRPGRLLVTVTELAAQRAPEDVVDHHSNDSTEPTMTLFQ